jgi:hypothetical protein
MAIPASVVIGNARVLLNDTDDGGIRWTDPELLAWLNEAAAEVVRIAPHASARTIEHQLVSGTLQFIPDDGVQLINIFRNAPAGRVVRIVDATIMDNERPSWHQDPASLQVTRYMFDPRNPRMFSVYPPNNGSGRVSLVYSAAPTPVVTMGQNIPVPDIYAAPLTNYICYRAWLKLVDNPASIKRAGDFKSLFDGQMGVKKQAEAESNPNLRSAVATE